MKRTTSMMILIVVIATPFFAAYLRQPVRTAWADDVPLLKGEFVPDRLLVRFRPTAGLAAIATLHGQTGAKVLRTIDALDVQILQIPAGQLETAYKMYANSPAVAQVSRDYIVRAALSPNDPYFTDGTQYGPQKIQAPAAWDIVTGSGVTVAIVDSGVDPNHPEFQGRLVPGYNFVYYNTNTADDYGHGTFVAGIALAAANNAEGIAGVAFDSLIMPVKVLDSTGTGTASSVAYGITYAADNGARVINASVGGPDDVFVLRDAVSYARGKGAIVVAAAGNYNSSTPFYPGSYSASFTVAGTDQNDARYVNSNYGTQIDVAAPGVSVYSTYWRSDIGSTYASGSGTSFAAPHVAGLAALLFAQNPSYTVSDVENLIAQNADDLGDPGWDQYFGYGRVNAFRALNGSTGPTPTPTAEQPTSTPSPTATPADPTPTPTATPADPTPTPTATPQPPTPTPTPTPPSDGSAYVQRVNAGGGAYSVTQGSYSWDSGTWNADQAYGGVWGYTGGTARASSNPVSGTTDDPLYQQYRENPGEYRFAVPNGEYEVLLRFAEFQVKKATDRQMRITIEGVIVEDALSIYGVVGRYAALDKIYQVTVSDGELNIRFAKNGGKKKPVVSAVAVRQLGAGGSTEPTPTPTATPDAGTSSIHVGDLDGVSSSAGRNWQATVTISIHDSNHAPVAGATISGSWAGGYSGSGSCTTDSSGQCSVSSGNIKKKKGSATFTVNNVTHATLAYRASDNHDPDGDSDGTVIRVYKP